MTRIWVWSLRIGRKRMSNDLVKHAVAVLPYWPPGVSRIKVSRGGDWMFNISSIEDSVRYESELAFNRLGRGAKNYSGLSCTHHQFQSLKNKDKQ
jgi:hypothetical protein